jgi:hypothetical protein
MELIELIPEGRENAISKAQLTEITGLSDRSLRLVVAGERRMGNFVLTDCGGTKGYYKPTNSGEVLAFIRSMRKRARETAAIADAVERALMRQVGQDCIEGWGEGE